MHTVVISVPEWVWTLFGIWLALTIAGYALYTVVGLAVLLTKGWNEFLAYVSKIKRKE